MLTEQLLGIVQIACRKSGKTITVSNSDIALGFTEALVHELQPYLQVKFDREAVEALVSKFYNVVYSSGMVHTPLVNDPCVDLVNDFERLHNGKSEPLVSNLLIPSDMICDNCGRLECKCCGNCGGKGKVPVWETTPSLPAGQSVLRPCPDCKPQKRKIIKDT